MRVWLVTAAEPIPSDGVRPMRFMGLASALVARGHEVTIWTQTFFHHTKRHRFESDTEYEAEGYRVIVLRTWGYRKNISLRRYVSHWHFARRLAAAMPLQPQPDVVVAALPPLDTVSAAAAYAERRGIRLVVDVIDPWPDVFVSLLHPRLQRLSRMCVTPLASQARAAMRRAAAITALSSSYASWARSLEADRPIPAATFFPAVHLRRPRETAGANGVRARASDHVRFVYAGALGRSYDVATVIAVAGMLSDAGEGRAEFVIAGAGPGRPALERLASGLPNVRFTGWLGAPQLDDLFASSDVGIACYRRRATQTVSYKLFDYLGAGLPIVSSLDGEMAEILAREGIGWNYPPEDARALSALVKRILDEPATISPMAQRARAFAESHGNAETIYPAMAAFIDGTSGQRMT